MLTNTLHTSASPYLKQHAKNPVFWSEWNNDTLEYAQKHNKPIIISIGYAACHWCHVMARESFMNKELADIMNRHFVCIKVDREERPDVDTMYMEVAHLLTGRGGWPLNAFALPNGKPFYAGTYFTPHQWEQTLKQIAQLYETKKPALEKQAEDISNKIQTNSLHYLSQNITENFSKEIYQSYFGVIENSLDIVKGGFKKAPKFPLPQAWEAILMYGTLLNNSKAIQAVTTTLNTMAITGIFDCVAGGFYRYSTDAEWKIPHFEKMLYDNAQLISLYSKAYALTKQENYVHIISKTIDFVTHELCDAEKGFYSSLNADSEGVEGKYYIWTLAELERIIPQDYKELFYSYYSISKQGNWEDSYNVLHAEHSYSKISKICNIDEETLKKGIEYCLSLLQNVRKTRIRPTTDTKIIASWNALMITALADAYRYTQNTEYKNLAIKYSTILIKNNVLESGEVLRINNANRIEGFSEDYACVAQMCIALYEITFDEFWLQTAKKIVDYFIQEFFSEEIGLFYYSKKNSESYVINTFEVLDNVIPSSNSITGKVLLKLGLLLYDNKYTMLAQTVLSRFNTMITEYGAYAGNWSTFYAQMSYGLKMIQISDKHEDYNKILEAYKPITVIKELKENTEEIQVCTQTECFLKVKRIDEINRSYEF